MSKKTDIFAATSAAVCLVSLAYADGWIIQQPVLPGYPFQPNVTSAHTAIAYFDRMLENNPSDWKACFERGRAYERVGCSQLALDDCTHALSLHPLTPAIIREIANIQHSTGDFKGALSNYDLVIKITGGASEDFANRSFQYIQLQDAQEAAADAQHAINIMPNLGLAYLARACAESNLGKYDQALSDCDKSVSLYSHLALRADICRSQIYIRQKQWQRSIDACNHILPKFPQNAQALWLRALAFYNIENFEQALTDATNSICQNPMVAAPYLIRSQTNHHLKRFDDAELDLEQAIKLNHGMSRLNQLHSLNTTSLLEQLVY